MNSTRDRLLDPNFQVTLAHQLRETLPAVKMLVLFGSQATGSSHAKSDWDIAILADTSPWNVFLIQEKIAQLLALSFDTIDLVNISHCSPTLGFNVARDGQCLYERTQGLFEKFQTRAWKRFWDTAKFRKLQDQYIRETAERIIEDVGRPSHYSSKVRANLGASKDSTRDKEQHSSKRIS